MDRKNATHAKNVEARVKNAETRTKTVETCARNVETCPKIAEIANSQEAHKELRNTLEKLPESQLKEFQIDKIEVTEVEHLQLKLQQKEQIQACFDEESNEEDEDEEARANKLAIVPKELEETKKMNKRVHKEFLLLNVAGVQFPACKLVLSSCSTYFRALFTRWSSPDCHVFEISSVSADIMKIILDYCYTGVVHITQENCQELLIAADYFDVSGITQACCQFMENQLSPSNCISIWEITNKYYYPQLKNLAFLYILKHFEEVLTSSEEFLQISGEDLCSVIDEDRLNVREETTVLNAVLRWVAHAPEERNLYLANLLAKVRVALIQPKYFAQCMIRYNLLYNRNCEEVAINTLRVILAARARRSYAALPPTRLDTPRLPSAVLMAIGGWDENGPTNKIEVYDNRTNCWMGVALDDWRPRACHGTVFLNGSVYVIGGLHGHSIYDFVNTSHKYDLANHTWQEVAPMHSRRAFISVALLDGLIYAMGGDNGEKSLDTVERYSPETNQWTMISPMNEVRSNANSTAYNGKIYICGGQWLASAETYDPLTDQWTMIAHMANRRSGLGVIAYANEIYAIGGFNWQTWMNTVEAYNPTTNTWRPLPNMQTGRSKFGIGVVDDRLYVVGGNNGSHSINLVECFDVRTGVWTQVQDMKSFRFGLSCCVVFDLPNMADYAPPRPAPSHDDPAEE